MGIRQADHACAGGSHDEPRGFAPSSSLAETACSIAGGGGWFALRLYGDMSHVFLALGAALAAFGLINAAALREGHGSPPLNL